MKLNFTVEVDENDDVEYLENKIVIEAARQLIAEVMNNRYEHYGKTFREKLKDTVKGMLSDVMDTDFKNEVKNSLAEDLSKKYVRTKQFKEIKEQFSIDPDALIKSGMREIISELINAELKKKFK